MNKNPKECIHRDLNGEPTLEYVQGTEGMSKNMRCKQCGKIDTRHALYTYIEPEYIKNNK